MTDYERQKDTTRSRTEDTYSRIYRDEELEKAMRDLSTGGRALTEHEYRLVKEQLQKEIIKKPSLRISKKSKFQELRLIADEVIGNLFNRAEFLKIRINELESAFVERQEINQSQMAEITQDVEEKRKKLLSLSNIDDIREFELDITNLKMERRKEALNYWKDKLELKRELQELKEEFQNKSKIIEIFSKARIEE